jgi:hypothetical protein
MLFTRERKLDALRATTSTLQERIQQVAAELAELRARLSVLDGPDLIAGIAQRVSYFHAEARQAAEARATIGAAVEAFAAAMRTPPPRGRAGGLARARTAWRYLDGTFMPESVKLEAYREEYERHSAGGRARARTALRNPDGTFA